MKPNVILTKNTDIKDDDDKLLFEMINHFVSNRKQKKIAKPVATENKNSVNDDLSSAIIFAIVAFTLIMAVKFFK